MVDLKKINIPKVHVDPKKVMGAVDGLVDKIPPQIANLLKKIAMALLIFFILMGVYTGWTKGWESATPEGLQLASDTRSLFTVDIEKEYNRSRKDVRMSSPEDVKYESNHRMQFEFVSEREMSNPEEKAIPEVEDFLGKENDFRNRKNESKTPPLATPSGDGLISSPVHIESVGVWENSDQLKELGEPKELSRTATKPENKKVSKPADLQLIDERDAEDDLRFNKLQKRLEDLEAKSAEKKKRELERLPR